LTEQHRGGTAPEPEASASVADQASEQAVGAIAVADEPAETKTTTDTKSAPPAPAAGAATDRATTAASSAPGTPAPQAQRAASSADGAPMAEAAPTADVPTTAEARPTVEAAPTAEAASQPAVAEGGQPRPGPATPAAPAAAVDAPAAQATPAAPGGAPAVSGTEPIRAASTPALTADDTADAPAAEPDQPRAPAGPEPSTMEELLAEQDSDIKSFKHGDVVEGNVVRIDKDEILVDIGAKSEGVVSNRELYGRHAESAPQLNVGDTVLVYVLQPESQEGHVVLSLRRAGLERKWRAMQEQFEAGVIIEAPVIDHNKGGLIVDCGIRGFVPISQIVDFPRRPQNDQPRDAAQEIAEKLQPFVGRKLRLKILEVNRKANRLILSEKVALYEERREKRDELFSSLQVGQKVTGTVRSIAPFGVFIDLGGIDGLVHKSELSWNKVNNPEAGYKVGEEVEAEVIDINHERGRISLSIRRLQPDPWHSTVADYKVGDIIDGTVTKLVNFGAFVRVRDGLEGLIHISELSHQRVAHPGDVVHEGQALRLKIISLDSERHRLGLSLKQAEEPPVRVAPEPAAPRPERGERRPRPERGYSMADAVQEPEGGIDNTLAAAFAQVREQVAASEQAARSDEPAPAAARAEAREAGGAPAAADAPAAAAATADATAASPAKAEAAPAADATAASPAKAEAGAAADSTAASPAKAEAAEMDADAAAAKAGATEAEAPPAAPVAAPAPAAQAEAAEADATPAAPTKAGAEPTPAAETSAAVPVKAEATDTSQASPTEATAAEATPPAPAKAGAAEPARPAPSATAKGAAPAKPETPAKEDSGAQAKPEPAPKPAATVAGEADAAGE
jgi:small subunit ribosomal protein S1